MDDWATGIDPQFQFPFITKRQAIEPLPQASPILGLLPLILLLMTVTGGVYPAIDLTAGERERNTLETLMSLPVPRFRLLLAKYVAVVVVSVLTGLMNLIAMGVTLSALQLDQALLGEAGFSWTLAAKLFLVLFAFSLFYSALLLLLTSSARSFKEAQAYLIPLLLISLAPGMFILLPGWKLGELTSVVPMVNLLLLGREYMEGTASLLYSLIAISATVVYGAATLALAAGVFGNDAVGAGAGQWSDWWKQPEEQQATPTMEVALTGLAILFPCYFLISGWLGREGWDFSPNQRLGSTMLLTMLLFVGIPWLIMRWRRIDWRTGFRLNRFASLGLVGAILLGLSAWPWVFEVVILASKAGLSQTNLLIEGEAGEKVKQLLEGWKSVPLWLIVLALGITPGVCEECFFRGFLFSGLRRNLGAWATITVTAVLFGLFHIILAGGAAPERVLPSMLMGFLLGWVTWRTGSLIPAIALHAIHNSALLVMVAQRETWLKTALGDASTEHLPAAWLAIAAAGFLVGGSLVWWAGRKRSVLESRAQE